MKNYENYNANNLYDNASEDYEGLNSYYHYLDDEQNSEVNDDDHDDHDDHENHEDNSYDDYLDYEEPKDPTARLVRKVMVGREALGRLDDGLDHPVTVTKREAVPAEADNPVPKAEEPKTMSVSMEQYKSAVDWKRREYEHGTDYYRTPDGSIIPAGRYDPKDLNDAGNETVKR